LGVWAGGVGLGGVGFAPTPPTPNPQSPIPKFTYIIKKNFNLNQIIKYYFLFNQT